MNILWWILGIIGVPAVIFLFIILPADMPYHVKKAFKGRYYAHRGLHNIDEGIPENSLPAFEKAAQKGYGIELDVHLTTDGQVIVFHDDDLSRACGDMRKTEELSYSQLQELRLFGTDERIPLFSQVLQVYNGAGPMIVEIKTGKHNADLCQQVCTVLEHYKGKVCIESFDPRILRWFKKHRPRMVRGQLAQPAALYKNQTKLLSVALANCLTNCIGRPHFIAYRIGDKPPLVRLVEKMGAMSFCWTSREDKHAHGCDGVIFESYEPETKF